MNQQRVVRKQFCEFIGITPQYLVKMLKQPSLDSAKLERSCQFLGIDPGEFFDYHPDKSGHTNTIGSIEPKCVDDDTTVTLSTTEFELMKQLLEEKDARIRTLESNLEFIRELVTKGSAPSSESMNK